ncbi:MAG: hypothetical protein LBI64_08010 [Coriobacteriales bacterium]|jgi:hypothetical protein|nr:hypothetical protein [Coriobacteriales bacterium]
MLFILTGDIQIGKTRWLTILCEELMGRGIICRGVLSPGIWRRHFANDDANGMEARTADDSAPTFEKLGIETVLLPSGERFPFALRRDLAESAPVGTTIAVGAPEQAATTGQADRAQLGWAIRDEAIMAVNAHFDKLATHMPGRAGMGIQSSNDGDARHDIGIQADDDTQARPGLLVVDELGRLELLHEGGFTSAVRLLDGGPSPACSHALIVVRDQLASLALARFAPVWSDISIISPDAIAHTAVHALYARDLSAKMSSRGRTATSAGKPTGSARHTTA